MAKFPVPLTLRLVEDSDTGLWELLTPFTFESDLLGRAVQVPAGFRTDFCSVPRIPGVYDLLGNRARQSGTVHDWLYTSKEIERAQADAVLREMLRVDGVNWVQAQAFYTAVRMFGGSHWA